MKKTSNIEILTRGWDSLVKTLGPVNASYFIQNFPRGEEDSVKFWRTFWGSKNVDEIYDEIKRAKKEGEI